MSQLDAAALIALQQTVHAVVRALEAELREVELSPSETNLLACLDERGDGRRMRELVDATAQRPSTLTSVVDRLERRGLVRRDLDPKDRRSFRVHLTTDGLAVHGHVRAAYAAVARRGAEALAARETPTFADTLEALRRASEP